MTVFARIFTRIVAIDLLFGVFVDRSVELGEECSVRHTSADTHHKSKSAEQEAGCRITSPRCTTHQGRGIIITTETGKGIEKVSCYKKGRAAETVESSRRSHCSEAIQTANVILCFLPLLKVPPPFFFLTRNMFCWSFNNN